jgi:hypothetical protein
MGKKIQGRRVFLDIREGVCPEWVFEFFEATTSEGDFQQSAKGELS